MKESIRFVLGVLAGLYAVELFRDLRAHLESNAPAPTDPRLVAFQAGQSLGAIIGMVLGVVVCIALLNSVLDVFSTSPQPQGREAAREPAGKTGKLPGWVWVVAGLGGLVVTVLVYFGFVLVPFAYTSLRTPEVYQSREGRVTMVVIGTALAATAGVLSFRGTLKHYAKRVI
jgi:hypothetical protein